MATNASPFIVNLVDLQNISLNITGTSQASELAKAQTDILNIQEMVDYTTKTISADYIQSFTEGNTIQVLSPLNISTSSGSSGSAIISTVGGSNTYLNVNDITSTISFINAGKESLQLTSTGMLNYISSSTYFSTGIDIKGFLYASESAYVKNLYINGTQSLPFNNSKLGEANTYINVSSTTSTISFINNGTESLKLTSTGMLNYVKSPTYASTGINVTGWLYISETAYAGNYFSTRSQSSESVYSRYAIQLADSNSMSNIQQFSTTVTNVLQINSYKFNWLDNSNADTGFIGQYVNSNWPSLITSNLQGSTCIAYSRFIPLLLECIRELDSRVFLLESSSPVYTLKSNVSTINYQMGQVFTNLSMTTLPLVSTLTLIDIQNNLSTLNNEMGTALYMTAIPIPAIPSTMTENVTILQQNVSTLTYLMAQVYSSLGL
jgi:hypothetical protein